MRYLYLLLILCCAFFVLNSVTQFRNNFSFLSAGNIGQATSKGPRPAHIRWATASAMPAKGGPSDGIGLHAMASPASISASAEPSADQTAAMDAVGTVGVDVAAAAIKHPLVLTNPTHTQSPLAVADIAQDAPASSPIGGGLSAPVSADMAAIAAAPASASLDAAATSDADVLSMDGAEDISMSADYIDLDLDAMPDATGIEPSMSAFALSAQALAFADSIRNSLMDPHGIQFGGIASLNWSGASANAGDGHVSGAPLTGFALGLFADVPLHKNLSFRPSLEYSFEGYHATPAGGTPLNIHVAYLSAPLDLVYHTNVFNKRFFVGAGPYMAYALNGTYTEKGINTDMQFGNNYAAGDNLRRMDFGANMMAGILMDRNFILGATFDFGLKNIAPDGSAASVRTRSFGLTLGYVFRNRRNATLSTSAY